MTEALAVSLVSPVVRSSTVAVFCRVPTSAAWAVWVYVTVSVSFTFSPRTPPLGAPGAPGAA